MSVGAGKSVVIVGAGLAGSLLACYLGKLGYRVAVYERRSDPRKAGYAGGRSINLSLSARGLWALDGVGLKDEILTHAIPMRGASCTRRRRTRSWCFRRTARALSTRSIRSLAAG
ncbi:MAG: FAD-dependent oxidoreductase [Phycisphaerales bacterium]